VRCENETALCTARSGNNLTVTRGIEGTLAAAHAVGRAVVHTPTPGERLVTELLDTHLHTHGLGLIPPGTATNNTATATSGYSPRDPGHSAAHRVVHGQAPPADADANARVLARALGVPLTVDAEQGQVRPPAGTPSALARARNAARTDPADARHANTALWAATWGYFLWQLGPAFGNEDIRRARGHFVDHVRAGGPLPALRIADQPYGVLPVMAFDRWTDREGGDLASRRLGAAMHAFLRRLRDAVWSRSVAEVPRVTTRRPDGGPQASLTADPGAGGTTWAVSDGSVFPASGQFRVRCEDEIALCTARSGNHLTVTRGIEGTVAAPHALGRTVVTDGPATVARILGMAPVAQRYYGRTLLGMEYLAYLWRFADLALGEGWRTELAEASAALWGRLGLSGADARVGRGVFAADSYPIEAPLVESAPGAGDASAYLKEIGNRATPWKKIWDAPHRRAPATTPLLYRLLRHAALVEHAIAGHRVKPGSAREPELVDILPDGETPTAWRHLAQEITTATGARMPLGDYLGTEEAERLPAVADLAAFRSSARHLAGLPAATLERLMAETLDLSSHRLDAWITSFATMRLTWLRTREQGRTARGVHVGAYGWVADLRPPQKAPDTVAAKELPPKEPGPLVSAKDGGGFVQAPSLTHATTAAVLRAGHRSYASAAGGPLAVHLPSHRVRLASSILEGVRRGQPLGVLLGYRLERSLQEHPLPAMAVYVAAFRRVAPWESTRLEPGGPPRPVTAATDVVDGLALHRRWKAGGLDYARDLGLPPNQPAERKALDQVLADLDDAVDAVSDALLAEGVHHAVQGNPLRAGATVDAAARGEAPPPELEFARTPRTGLAVTHRVVVLLGETEADANAWPVDPEVQARAAAEPALNAWAARLLPRPASVRFRAAVAGAADPKLGRLELDLTGLRLSPLDWLYMPEPADAPQLSELERWLLRLVRLRPGVGPRAEVRLEFAREPSWGSETVSVGEFLEIVRATRALAEAARPLGPQHLDVPEAAATEAATDADLERRANAAVAALDAADQDLAQGADLGRVRRGLLRAAHLGVLGAVPPAPGPDDAGPLGAQAAAARSELARRHAALAVLAERRAKDEITPVEHDRGRLAEVFGGRFLALSRFVPENSAALGQALGASTSLQGGDALAAAGWAQQVARVREPVDRLASALGYAEALGSGDGLSFTVAQLPYASGDRWLGLRLDGTRPSGSRVSLVVHAPTAPRLDAPLAGLLVDEWVEVIPSPAETTGVAFHFDSPGACAPQAILLAVPPDARASWTPELLEETLTEALELARLRTVDAEALHPIDPDALTDIGQFLPAAYFATNLVNRDAIATDFTAGRA
jgi:hypothetical protein